MALKWVGLRPEIDPLSGAVHDDRHSFGCSEADRAALEWALRLAETWPGADAGGVRPEVVAVTVGPPEADALLRDALAAGATRAVRAELAGDASSPEVAAGSGQRARRRRVRVLRGLQRRSRARDRCPPSWPPTWGRCRPWAS